MKKILYSLMAFALLAVSCEKTTEGLTGITYYPVITVNGDAGVIYVGETSYEDPGCTAVMNGEDITDQVVVSDNINFNQVGAYAVTYTATNEQGFSASASRDVYVVKENSIDNLYMSVVHGAYDGGTISITDNGDGTYTASDLCGGYYSYYRYPGYPYDFDAEVTFKINEDGSLTQIGDALDWYFGDPADPSTMEDGYYDAETGGFYWVLCFSGEPNFYVNLYPIVK